MRSAPPAAFSTAMLLAHHLALPLILAHGILNDPPSRNAIDADDPRWAEGKFPKNDGTPGCTEDIGWADFGYNNGTALTPNIDKWTRRAGTVVMQDGHSGGTVCSPTRATILTGRNHFRDCVGYVYGCSDMTECQPSFPFAQQRTFTFL